MLFVLNETEKEFFMTTGQIIYEARRKAGMTQEELADRLGVSRQAVSKWESDTAFPETDKIIELCKLFDLSADELLLGAEGRKSEKAEGEKEEQPSPSYLCDKEKLHFEYVSKTKIGSLPLVHINFGLGHYRAKGVIAIGNVATGFVSIGFIAVGLLSMGLMALGALAFGTVALGLLVGAGAVSTGALAFGGVAIGIMTFGGVSIGYISIGGCAIAQYAFGGAAQGFVAVGQQWAAGTNAFKMPEAYDELCAFADANFTGWLCNFIKAVALTLCG